MGLHAHADLLASLGRYGLYGVNKTTPSCVICQGAHCQFVCLIFQIGYLDDGRGVVHGLRSTTRDSRKSRTIS